MVVPLEHLVHRADQVEDARLETVLHRQRVERDAPRAPCVNFLLLEFQLLQVAGDVLEPFILDQFTDQLPAWVLEFLLVLDFHLLIHWQQFAALDVHQRGGHYDEFPRQLEVEALHHLHVLEELRGQLGHVDFINIHFLFPDEKQEEIHRAFEDFELDFEVGHPGTAGAVGEA